MEKIIRKVINNIEKNGFEAYVVGGYVRDLVLGKHSYDIDICTNALPKDLISIFPNGNVGIYGAISFMIGKYSFEITTYRQEFTYQNRHPSKVEYVNSLLTDLNRRDFKINTLCMGQKSNIIDLLGAMDDINNKVITCVGNTINEIKEDPLRILRAIRFATILDFDLSADLLDSIKNNNTLITSLSDERIISEVAKILINDNYLKGLTIMRETGILKMLGISYGSIVKTSDINGMWAQLTFDREFNFSKEACKSINTIRKIVNSGNIDSKTIYSFGLYYSLVAGEILKMDKKKIYSMYKKMPIRSFKDVSVKSEKIIEFLNLQNKEEIGNIFDELVDKILNGSIKNNTKAIYNYLNNIKKEW